jgi:hypothetical protein
MFPRYHRKLSTLVRQALGLHLSRADCFAACALAAVEDRTVKLSSLAARLPGSALLESKYRRVQDFFCEFTPDYNTLAQFLVGMLDEVLGDKPLILAMDRTNWEARKNDVNLLVMSVCLGDTAQPLLWSDLRRKGNSDTRQRRRLMRRFLKAFGHGRIGAVVGDREFVGEDWFAWLLEEEIPFVMRLRENFKTRLEHGTRVEDAKQHFNGLRPGECLDLGCCEICGVHMGVCGLRLKDGELLILGYWGMDADGARDVFMKRWNIETGFQKLKSHGFDMEASRLRGGGKMERLMAVLAVGFAWCYAVGHWSVKAVGPIRFIKKLMRPAICVFRRGLDLLCGLLHGACPLLRRVSRKAFDELRAASLAPT